MAGEDGDAPAGLTARSARGDAEAEFFQTVRRLAGARPRVGPPVGGDLRPQDEPVRFHAAAGMRFAETELAAVQAGDAAAPAELVVNFMGLTGPSGVLPDHYTELVVERRRARDPSLNAFLDLFNHRAVSLFYRAWAKYRLPVAFEERRGALDDDVSTALASLAGLGFDALRPGPAQATLLAMAGPLSRRTRSADGLRRVVAALCELPVEVRELEGRWIDLQAGERTRLGAGFATLGVDAVAGAAVYDVQSRIRLRFGPMGLDDFRAFFDADGLRRTVGDAVRLAVGPAVSFDMQLVLRRAEAPPLRLGDPSAPALLGRTTWMLDPAGERDLDDAVLSG